MAPTQTKWYKKEDMLDSLKDNLIWEYKNDI